MGETKPAINDRRGFLDRACSWFMGVGLVAGYGTFVAIAARFLYPVRAAGKAWLFVAEATKLRVGQSIVFRDPTGRSIVIARLGEANAVDSFVALSSICPHLGCHVHWETSNHRFFCPCHNGAFDAAGVAMQGPPKDAGQSLSRYRLKIENQLLFIEVSTERLT